MSVVRPDACMYELLGCELAAADVDEEVIMVGPTPPTDVVDDGERDEDVIEDDADVIADDCDVLATATDDCDELAATVDECEILAALIELPALVALDATDSTIVVTISPECFL